MLEALQTWQWSLDGWIVVAGLLCGVASATIGCFLVLRRMSLMGDAISHAVLPGLAAAFLLTHSRSSLPMFIGWNPSTSFSMRFTSASGSIAGCRWSRSWWPSG